MGGIIAGQEQRAFLSLQSFDLQPPPLLEFTENETSQFVTPDLIRGLSPCP